MVGSREGALAAPNPGETTPIRRRGVLSSVFDPEEGAAEPEEPENLGAKYEEVEAPADLRARFWLLVGLLNVALLAGPLGVMFWYFRGRLVLGSALVAFGLLTVAHTYVLYRRWR